MEEAQVFVHTQAQSGETAIPTYVLYLLLGPHGRLGHLAQRPVEVGHRTEEEGVMVASMVAARMCAPRVDRRQGAATLITAPSLPPGAHGGAGRPAVRPVGEGHRAGPGGATWPSMAAAQLCVHRMARRQEPATQKAVLLMLPGENGPPGAAARPPAAPGSTGGSSPATRPSTGGTLLPAPALRPRRRTVAIPAARWTVCGAAGDPGEAAAGRVLQGCGPRPGAATMQTGIARGRSAAE